MSSEQSKPSAGTSNGRQRNQPPSQPAKRPTERLRVSESEHTRPDSSGRNVDLDQISALLRGEPADKAETSQSSRTTPRNPSRDDDDDARAAEARQRPGLEFDEDDGDEGEPRRRARKASSLDEFAEKHGLSARDVYDLMVDTGIEGDGPKSFGELKDHYRQTRDFEALRDQFEDDRSESMNQIITARQQIDGVVNRLAGVIPPQQLAELFREEREAHAERIRTARAQALEFYPEWRDGDRMAADRDALIELLGSYGFSRQEVVGIPDSRLLKFAEDARRLMARYKRLKEGGQREKRLSDEPPARRSHKPSKFEQARGQAQKGDVLAGIRTLIR